MPAIWIVQQIFQRQHRWVLLFMYRGRPLFFDCALLFNISPLCLQSVQIWFISLQKYYDFLFTIPRKWINLRQCRRLDITIFIISIIFVYLLEKKRFLLLFGWWLICLQKRHVSSSNHELLDQCIIGVTGWFQSNIIFTNMRFSKHHRLSQEWMWFNDR